VTKGVRETTLVLAAVALGGSFASAQNTSTGAKAGISRSAISASEEFAWRSGQPTAALVLRRSLRSAFSVQGEVGGFRRLGVSTQIGSTLTLTADYIELPILLQWHPRAWGPLRPFLDFGPSTNYRVRCSLVFQGGGVSSDNDCDAGFGARSNKLDIGAAGGVGFDWQIGGAVLQVESRASGGARTNVLPIDVNSRAVSWNTTAGVLTPLTRGARIPSTRLPQAPAPRRMGNLNDENIAAILLAYATSGISYARLVPRRSARLDVRAFAQQMALDHVDIVRAVNAVVAALDIEVRDNGTSLHMRDESSGEREPLYFVSGAPFDTGYVATSVRFQRGFLAALDSILAQPPHSQQMRALVLHIRPEVENRLSVARHLLADLQAKPLVAYAPPPPRR
jgi:predicted outer membrane protein